MPDARDLPTISTDDIDDQTKFVVVDGNNGSDEDAGLVNFNDVLPSIRGIVDSAQQYVDNANSALSENRQTVNSYVANAQQSLGSINLLSGSRGTSDKNTRSIGEFELIPFLVPDNGATQLTPVGKFIDNTIEQDGVTSSLLAAMGREEIDAQYGAEFYVCETTAGTATSRENPRDDAAGHYLLFNTYEQSLPAVVSFYAWIRVISGELSVFAYNAWLDGSINQYPVIRDNSWHHVGAQYSTTGGSIFAFPQLYATPGSVIQIALPTVNAGVVGPKIITAPEVEI